MEEDSKSRSERLRAMRAEAVQAEASGNVENPGVLSNPLLDAPAAHDDSSGASRFGFYTDPMAAFSANKRRGAPVNQGRQGYFEPSSNSVSPVPRFSSPYPGPRNPGMTPYPAHQSPGHYQARSPYHGAAPSRGPIGMTSPLHMNQGTPPQVWNGSGGTANYYAHAPHRGMAHTQGDFNFRTVERPNFNYGGRGHWRGSSPSPSSGRSQGQRPGGSMSQRYGQGVGRGRGYHSPGHRQYETKGPECFYEKSMVEDPWQNLEPVVWKGFADSANNFNAAAASRVSNVSSMKKMRVSEPSNRSSSGQSLAEYLAASFNEAVNDA